MNSKNLTVGEIVVNTSFQHSPAEISELWTDTCWVRDADGHQHPWLYHHVERVTDPIKSLLALAQIHANDPIALPTPEEDAMVEEYLARHANEQEPDDDDLEGTERYEPSDPADDYGFSI